MSKRKEAAERYLRESLMEGEEVLWEGRTASFKLLEGSDGKKVGLCMAATVLASVLMIAYYVTDTPEYQWSVLLFLITVMGCLLAAPILSWVTLRHQRYWITDRRVLTIRGSLVEGDMSLADLDELAVHPLRPGVESLSLGSQVVSEGTRQLRWRSCHPLEAAPAQHVGMVLYGLENADRALDTLQSLTGVQAA